MKIPLISNLGLLSESARAAKEKPKTSPEWWNRLSKNQQEVYVGKHPKTYLKAFVKKSDIKRKKKLDQDSTPAKKTAKKSNIKRKKEVEPVKKKSGRYATKPKTVKASVKEKLRRKEEQRIIDDTLPTVKRSFMESFKNVADKVTHIASAINSKMSKSSKDNLSKYMKSRKAGTNNEKNEDGRKVANKVLMSVAHAAIGAAIVASIASGAAPLAGALTAAYLSFRDYRKSLEGTKYESKRDEEDDDQLASESSNEEDPVEELVSGFTQWLGNQDLDGIAEKFAEYAAIEKMEQSGWTPDTSMLDEDELDTLMQSESGATPRLTFKMAKNLKNKTEDQRSEFHVMFADRQVGRVYADSKFASKTQRMWLAELEDGFNEATYKSGKQEVEPYTLVKNGVVLLRNPTKFTFTECCSWIKHNIDKNFL